MKSLRELLTENQWETVKVKAILTPFPVRFEFPIETRETIPKSVIKSIEGVRVLRFYTPPVSPDIIEFRGYRWKVLGRFHEDVKVQGSPKKDKMPIVITELIGAVAE
jgi:hypothetical protein